VQSLGCPCACRKPFSEEQYAAGFATFESLLDVAEKHLTQQNTPFLTGNTITMAVGRSEVDL